MKKFLVILAILLLAVGLAGCKEDVDKQQTTKSDRASASGSGSSGSADADVKEASGSSGVGEKITNYISKKKNMEFSVSYDYSVSGSGTNEQWEMTQYFGNNKYRMDMKADGQETQFFYIGKEVTSCSKDKNEWMCMVLGTGEEMNDPTEQFSSIEDDLDDTSATYKGTKKIAGTTAHCWGINYASYMGNTEFCYTKNGIPLYMLIESGGAEIELKAKSFKNSVSASDFQPPAEPIDMNAMMAQYGAYQ